ncbi:3-deoxy-manno-octulosonate-8-phosphatase KdsC [Echinimonas agarilytica]|uniref:3-deoxy-D-manno-octulosonate 8-phosphate phosphatase KdsC n=1 Tax=Echinimonas agarilytica TaxID=1215918 RepID=A0AA41W4D6_9GAMM|nr:3-deoxy-manno-octulosonate-8-phosphatase KdsC [Echinimonas agarilytica]MCM2678615.1 3-deoxy-manno-octulosonate-8-phosphatase KdsC [Echinimonas agarilytica]
MGIFHTLYGSLDGAIEAQLIPIKLLICDVDGVFSDGRIYMGNDGEELKTFHTRDGYGVKALQGTGVDVAVITGRSSNIVSARMSSLGVEHLYQGCDNKLEAFHQILTNTKLDAHECAYIGDDLIDWPVMAECGMSICVADGHPWLRQRAKWTTQTAGGFGAVREVCDTIMQAQGTFNTTMGRSI